MMSMTEPLFGGTTLGGSLRPGCSAVRGLLRHTYAGYAMNGKSRAASITKLAPINYTMGRNSPAQHESACGLRECPGPLAR